MKKKILGIVTVLAIAIFAMTAIADTSSQYVEYSIVSGKAVVTGYTGNERSVKVADTYNGTAVTSVQAGVFNSADIEVVYLPKTVTTVEANAFANCSPDVKVIIDMDSPDAAIPVGMSNWGVENAQGAITYFMGNGKTTMTLSNSQSTGGSTGGTGGDSSTSTYAEIKAGSIYELLRTQNFTVSQGEFETIVYTNAGEPAEGAVDVSKDLNETVMMWEDNLDLYFWFDGDELMMPDDMSGYFSGLSVQQIDGLNLFNTSNVTKMNAMFHSVQNIEYLDLSSFESTSITNIVKVFHSSPNLHTVDMRNFDLSNYQNGEYSFFSFNDNLTTVYVGNQFDADIISNDIFDPEMLEQVDIIVTQP